MKNCLIANEWTSVGTCARFIETQIRILPYRRGDKCEAGSSEGVAEEQYFSCFLPFYGKIPHISSVYKVS